MKLVCKYCGHVIEYDGVGWFPGYVTRMYNHIFGKHVRMEEFFDEISDTITYRACIDPGYSEETDPVASDTLTVTKEDRLRPPAYSTPTEATVKSDA